MTKATRPASFMKPISAHAAASSTRGKESRSCMPGGWVRSGLGLELGIG